MNRRGFAPIIIAIAIALVAILIGGGYAMYKNRTRVQTPVMPQEQNQGQTSSSAELSTSKTVPATALNVQSIVKATDQAYSNNGHDFSYDISVHQDRIIFGDLDGDGINEAIAPVSMCAASCGTSMYAFKLHQGKILAAEISGTDVSGAAQAIDSFQITKNGTVVVTETDFEGTRTNSYRVQLINGKLVSTSLSVPAITSISPAAARVGTQVFIIGSGFMTSGKIEVNFGKQTLEVQDSKSFGTFVNPNGQMIAFEIPDSDTGTYSVSVTNANGTSNSVTFTVTPYF